MVNLFLGLSEICQNSNIEPFQVSVEFQTKYLPKRNLPLGHNTRALSLSPCFGRLSTTDNKSQQTQNIMKFSPHTYFESSRLLWTFQQISFPQALVHLVITVVVNTGYLKPGSKASLLQFHLKWVNSISSNTTYFLAKTNISLIDKTVNSSQLDSYV